MGMLGVFKKKTGRDKRQRHPSAAVRTAKKLKKESDAHKAARTQRYKGSDNHSRKPGLGISEHIDICILYLDRDQRVNARNELFVVRVTNRANFGVLARDVCGQLVCVRVCIGEKRDGRKRITIECNTRTHDKTHNKTQ